MTRRAVTIVLALLLFGLIRWPIETQLTEEHRRAYFHGAKLDLSLRQRLGQGAFLGALSGFRSIVADFTWFDAYDAWQKTEWGRLAHMIELTTTLQPRGIRFWDEGAWHMGWNASTAMLNDRSLREAQKLRNREQYLTLAEDILKRGIQNNPDRWNLYFTLGNLYRDKFEDHCRAAEAFNKAASFDNAPKYMKRFALYELAQCPGHEAEAYDRLKTLYMQSEKEHLPTLINTLRRLEEKLAIPVEQRIYNRG